jgi:tRNA dimethylallyltransferase
VTAPLVIVGPTASGKSGLALQLARRHGAEIVSADAMAVYRDMDIGTAKPTAEERAEVPHHGLDVVDAGEEFTVAQFQQLAAAAIADIESRRRPVVVVGGTGLYIRAVVDDFDVPPRYPEIRARLQADPDTNGLWRRLAQLDPPASTKMLPSNRRRIIRALEVTIGSGRAFSGFGPGVDRYPPTRFMMAGLDIGRDDLDRRIDERYDRQMIEGMLAEVAAVAEAGMSRTAAQALGYKELLAHLRGDCTLDDALDEAKRRTRRFARRQQRWFRRDPRIVWFDAVAGDLVEQIERWWPARPSEVPDAG